MVKETKGQKGITLVALVITVIVLLILAGVAMSMISGQDGLFTKANTAQEKTNEKSQIEAIQVAWALAYSDLFNDQTGQYVDSTKKIITKEALQAKLSGATVADAGETADGSFVVTFTNPAGVYDVSKGGAVTVHQ